MSVENDSAPSPTAAPAGIAHAIGSRNLIIIIVTMPLVFIAMVMATIAIFGRPGEKKARAAASAPSVESPVAQASMAPAPVATVAFPATPLVIPMGSDIGAMALDGDRLVLRVSAEGGGEIIVYDIAKGALLQRILLLEDLAPNDP